MIISLAHHTPDVARALFVAPSADIAGNVTLADDVSVFYSSTLRSESSAVAIGARTNLQDGVVIHADPTFPTTVGEGVTVGHRAVLHGCTVGDHCLIGMNAVVLNGAVIGAESLVAAGAVVAEGTVIPPRSLVVGIPAQVKKGLDDAAVAKLHASYQTYLTIAAAHAAAHRGQG